MARINLLPWREAERTRRQREFVTMVAGAVAVTLLLGVALYLHIDRLIDYQQSRNDYLQREIAQLDQQIKEIQDLEKTKANLLARMRVIQELQESRPEVVRLFDELVNAIPEGVYLTKLNQTARTVVVEGRAQSNARVSAFMRKIEESKWVGKPALLLIENKDKTGTGFSHFQLEFSQQRPRESESKTG